MKLFKTRDTAKQTRQHSAFSQILLITCQRPSKTIKGQARRATDRNTDDRWLFYFVKIAKQNSTIPVLAHCWPLFQTVSTYPTAFTLNFSRPKLRLKLGSKPGPKLNPKLNAGELRTAPQTAPRTVPQTVPPTVPLTATRTAFRTAPQMVPWDTGLLPGIQEHTLKRFLAFI